MLALLGQTCLLHLFLSLQAGAIVFMDVSHCLLQHIAYADREVHSASAVLTNLLSLLYQAAVSTVT